MTQLLNQICDATRLTQKFLAGRGDQNDLAAIGRTIRVWLKISTTLTAEKTLEAQEREDYDEREWTSVDILISRMHVIEALLETIEKALGSDIESTAGSPDELEQEAPDELSQLENWKISTIRWYIKPEYVVPLLMRILKSTLYRFSQTLRSLHTKFQRLLTKKERLEDELRSSYGIYNLQSNHLKFINKI